MLEIRLHDKCSENFAAMPGRLREALSSKLGMLAAALESRIQQKLSGAVLNQHSGALARSIAVTIDDGGTNIAARIGSAGSVKYAAIQEFGGTIPPHEILPNKARALAFAFGGKQIFAARVNLPAVTMPDRSYLRSSLAEMKDEINEGLQQAMLEVLQ